MVNRQRFMARYLAGDCRQVWRELVALGPDIVRIEEEAVVVAQELMSRVSANLDALIPRLREIGFCFGQTQDSLPHKYWCGSDPVRTLPDQDLGPRIADLYQRTGRTLPL